MQSLNKRDKDEKVDLSEGAVVHAVACIFISEMYKCWCRTVVCEPAPPHCNQKSDAKGAMETKPG